MLVIHYQWLSPFNLFESFLWSILELLLETYFLCDYFRVVTVKIKKLAYMIKNVILSSGMHMKFYNICTCELCFNHMYIYITCTIHGNIYFRFSQSLSIIKEHFIQYACGAQDFLGTDERVQSVLSLISDESGC